MKNIILISFIFGAFIFQINSLDLEKIRSDILTDHNYYRKKHQADELQRSAEIEKVAQAYSVQLAAQNKMVHSGGIYGENLFYCYSSSGICVTGQYASQDWYDEVKDYDYNNPVFSSKTGHFTQVVWKGTQKIGCGAACNAANNCYVTCNYNPPGNYKGEFAANVLKPPTAGGDDSDNGDNGNTGNNGNAGNTGNTGNTGNNAANVLTEDQLEKIRADILENHNYHRGIHQADNLIRNSNLEQIAQKYSEKLAAKNSGLTHSNNGYGENLYSCWASRGICVTGEKASEKWYSEEQKYDYDKPGYTSGIGHFSQLVWVGSKEIGCGAACTSTNECYVTCNYSPAGNYIGEFEENVLRPLNPIDDNGKYLTANKILFFISFLIFLI
jgi:uncharacterized protein YkwD